MGDFRDCGVVFDVATTPIYFNRDGLPNIGLACAFSDLVSTVIWGCYRTSIASTARILVSTGPQNDDAIDAVFTTLGIANDICTNFTLNAYND